MYSEEILDLYAEKPNYGKLSSKTHEAEHVNPICGDHFKVELEVEDDVVKDVKYTSNKSCFIASLSSCVVSEMIKGMKVSDVLKLSKKDIDNLLGKEIIETRIKCELLFLEAVKKAIIENVA